MTPPTRNERLEHCLNVIEASAKALRAQYEATEYSIPFAEDVANLRQAAVDLYAMAAAPRPRKPTGEHHL